MAPATMVRGAAGRPVPAPHRRKPRARDRSRHSGAWLAGEIASAAVRRCVPGIGARPHRPPGHRAHQKSPYRTERHTPRVRRGPWRPCAVKTAQRKIVQKTARRARYAPRTPDTACPAARSHRVISEPRAMGQIPCTADDRISRWRMYCDDAAGRAGRCCQRSTARPQGPHARELARAARPATVLRGDRAVLSGERTQPCVWGRASRGACVSKGWRASASPGCVLEAQGGKCFV